MFDKLIVSESAGADIKNRRRYFVVSSLLVGTLFLAAVVISIYSAEIGLGSDEFEMAALLTPVAATNEVPEPPKPREPLPSEPQASAISTRRVLMAPVDAPIVPFGTSVLKNQFADIPTGPVELGAIDTNAAGGRNVTCCVGPGLQTAPPATEVAETTPPALLLSPVKPSTPVKPAPAQSLGVINGKATYLPRPQYPPAAIAVNAHGRVEVQVTIDENGSVISAKAVNGHPLLMGAAEKAAWGAHFTPTFLSKVPVKVTGVIVYNFTR